MTKHNVALILLFLLLLGTVFLLTQKPLLLAGIILLAQIAKYKIAPIEREWTWFFGVAVLSAVIEIGLVNITSSWTYSAPQFYGIPYWPPVFWAFLACFAIGFYKKNYALSGTIKK